MDSIIINHTLPGLVKVTITKDRTTERVNLVRTPSMDDAHDGREIWIATGVNHEVFNGDGFSIHKPLKIGTLTECVLFLTEDAEKKDTKIVEIFRQNSDLVEVRIQRGPGAMAYWVFRRTSHLEPSIVANPALIDLPWHVVLKPLIAKDGKEFENEEIRASGTFEQCINYIVGMKS